MTASPFAGYASECTGEGGSTGKGALERCKTAVAYLDNKVVFYNDGGTDAQCSAGAFADMLAAIAAAERFVFIADWSHHPLFIPVHGGASTAAQSIGAALIHKARQGVTVAIHTWNHTRIGARDVQNDDGEDYLAAIATEIGETVPANLLWRASSRTGFGWSHHQKFLVCDGPPAAGSSKRSLRAFFGGLDITKGRFDWPDHPHSPSGPEASALKKTWRAGKYTVDEWYNPEFADNHALPRQPWHDVHAVVAGPAAWGFVREFVGRWNRDPAGFAYTDGDEDIWPTNKIWKLYQDLRAAKDVLQPGEPGHFGPWSVEVCRSLEKKHWATPPVPYNPHSRSPPVTPIDHEFDWNLDEGFERSIQSAYLNAIAGAQEFIYIENQYLIGSGAEWSKRRRAVANSVPRAIVERVLARAREGKPFHVYIVLPMFPEGAPNDSASATCRNYQWQTISYMIRSVQAGLGGTSWENYLSFYFLANWRQMPSASRAPPPRTESERNGLIAKYQGAGPGWMSPEDAAISREITKYDRKTRVRMHDRYMIYVHSKFMLVDDRKAILGSANLNERSLAGDRDSEIACLMYADPRQAGAANQCHATLRLIRRRLWQEHCGSLPKAWTRPNSSDCIAQVKSVGTVNYIAFRSMARPPRGHLCRWPFKLVNGAITLSAGAAGADLAGAALAAIGARTRDIEEYTEGEHLIPDAAMDAPIWQWNSPGSALMHLCE